MDKNKSSIYYIDGGARGNPGESGIGVVEIIGDMKKCYYGYTGISTNNEAEYSALIKALELAVVKDITCVKVFSDSELICKQISGSYKVKSETLSEFYNKALKLISLIKNFSIIHIPRTENKEADKLANLAMDLKKDGEL
jgi:ribonuclease HI